MRHPAQIAEDHVAVLLPERLILAAQHVRDRVQRPISAASRGSGGSPAAIPFVIATRRGRASRRLRGPTPRGRPASASARNMNVWTGAPARSRACQHACVISVPGRQRHVDGPHRRRASAAARSTPVPEPLTTPRRATRARSRAAPTNPCAIASPNPAEPDEARHVEAGAQVEVDTASRSSCRRAAASRRRGRLPGPAFLGQRHGGWAPRGDPIRRSKSWTIGPYETCNCVRRPSGLPSVRGR